MLQNSEEQFQELLAHLISRANKVLSVQSQMPVLSLLLDRSGGVEVAAGIADSPADLTQVLSKMQVSLQDKASAGNALATCVAYHECDAGVITVMLENHENYCATVKIPIVHRPDTKLDVESMRVEDGSVMVFPVGSGG
jgi:hypothetical protein